MILCNGHNKSRALQAAIEGPVTQAWTISALQTHKHGIIVCDESATDELKVSTYKYFKDIEKDNLQFYHVNQLFYVISTRHVREQTRLCEGVS